MPLLILSSLAPPVACVSAGNQRAQPQPRSLALTGLSRMGLPLRETRGASDTWGKSVHGNDLGKRSLFLSVPARMYLRKKNPFVFLHFPFSLGQPPQGSVYHSALVLCWSCQGYLCWPRYTASHAGNCVFGCGFWLKVG